MSDPKHTPGPWTYEGGEVLDAERNLVCHLYDSMRLPEEDDANGRAMAATPELLEVVRALPLHWLTKGVLANPASDCIIIEMAVVGTSYKAELSVRELRAAAAAIAKSEGRS